MRPAFFCFLSLIVSVALTGFSHAQCTSETVNSFSLSPTTISGDESDLATATIQGCIPQNDHQLVVYISEQQISVTKTYCYGGVGFEGTCGFPGSPGNVTFSFAVAGHGGTTDMSGTVSVSAYGQTPLTQPLTVTAIANPYELPPQDPDGPCPTGNCSGAGQPINVTNGNTYIPQQDYFMPGIGGGFDLEVPALVDLLKGVLSVIDVIRRGRRPVLRERLLHSPPKRVVLEAHGAASARQDHLRQPILEVPTILRARRVGLAVAVVVVTVAAAGDRGQLVRRIVVVGIHAQRTQPIANQVVGVGFFSRSPLLGRFQLVDVVTAIGKCDVCALVRPAFRIKPGAGSADDGPAPSPWRVRRPFSVVNRSSNQQKTRQSEVSRKDARGQIRPSDLGVPCLRDTGLEASP